MTLVSRNTFTRRERDRGRSPLSAAHPRALVGVSHGVGEVEVTRRTRAAVVLDVLHLGVKHDGDIDGDAEAHHRRADRARLGEEGLPDVSRLVRDRGGVATQVGQDDAEQREERAGRYLP